MKILFAGNKTAGHQCLKFLSNIGADVVGVLTSDKPELEKSNPFLSVAHFAQISGIEVVSIKDAEKLDFDVIFSVFYNKIIPNKLLNKANTAINFHGGTLPTYKGAFSNIWAIINNEAFLQITAHHMTSKLDEGEIVKTKSMLIYKFDTGGTLYEKMTNSTIDLFKDVYYDIEYDSLGSVPQKKGGTTYPRKLPNNGWIDWAKPVDEINRFIRALSFKPFQPARTKIEGKEVWIYDAVVK